MAGMFYSPGIKKINEKNARRTDPKIFDERVVPRHSQINLGDEEDERHGKIGKTKRQFPFFKGDCPKGCEDHDSDDTNDIDHPDPEPVFKSVTFPYPA